MQESLWVWDGDGNIAGIGRFSATKERLVDKGRDNVHGVCGLAEMFLFEEGSVG